MKQSRVSTNEILSDILAIARLLNHSPSSVEYAHFGRYDVRTAQRKFKVPWSEIVNLAGLRYRARTSNRIVTTEELRRDLLCVARQLGHVPTLGQYQRNRSF